MRTVITGGPKTGKTFLSLCDVRPVYHTDDTIDLGWSEASEEVSRWMDKPGPWVIEGVAAVRALRKWMDRNPEGAPCDEVVMLSYTFGPLTNGQKAMAKGVSTVLAEIESELGRRGVQIRRPR